MPGGDLASAVLLTMLEASKASFKKEKEHPAESSSQPIFKPVPHRLSQPGSLPVEARGEGFMVSFPVSYCPLWMPTVSAMAPLVPPASLTVISNQLLEKKSVGLSSGSTPLHMPYSVVALSTVLPF